MSSSSPALVLDGRAGQPGQVHPGAAVVVALLAEAPGRVPAGGSAPGNRMRAQRGRATRLADEPAYKACLPGRAARQPAGYAAAVDVTACRSGRRADGPGGRGQAFANVVLDAATGREASARRR